MKHSVKLAAIFALVTSCQSMPYSKKYADEGLVLPFIKNSPNECYYLDEFMPVPNNLVLGKTGSLNIRYYSYNSALYKDWPESQIVLSFYSKDDKCWSLYEEYFVAQ